MILFCSLGMFASLYTVLTYIGDMIIHESKRVCHICCIWHSTNKTWVIFITLSLGIMDSKWWSWECPLEWEITLFVYNIETRWTWRPIICMVLYQALFLELFPINKVLYPSFICHWFTGRGEIILAVGIGFGGLCCFGEEAAVDG